MTKEEILNKKHWNSEYPNYMAEDQILEAMEEYAQQESISFLNWFLESSWTYLQQNERDESLFIEANWARTDESKTCTQTELYKLYLDSKTK